MTHRLLDKLEKAAALDSVGDRLQAATHAVIRSQRLRDLLHGVWLGHSLHPVLVQAPVGAFISAAVLDLLPGRRRAATTLITLGTVTAVPAAAAGLTDWASLARDQRRIGLVHAAGNTVALTLYIASLAARLRGRHGLGRALGYAGLSAAGGSAYLGGHLSYKQGAGVNQAVSDLRRLPDGWQNLGPLEDIPDSRPVVRRIGDVAILLYRHGDRLSALLNRCSHASGPLDEGTVVGSGADACVVCPWHGSEFSLTDGRVVHGPASSAQPLLRSRITDGQVEVALP
jgi:nitrite reductase/ring-hydroxylating ferredoxin subunit/uncharacterized membrane protein